MRGGSKILGVIKMGPIKKSSGYPAGNSQCNMVNLEFMEGFLENSR